jgi:hypothetical protein
MTGAFQAGIPFNPMRFREEIKAVEFSSDRLELLLKRYGARITVKEREVLLTEIREETTYLENSWQALESKLLEIEKTEIPYYFIREQTKRKIKQLLEESSKLVMDNGS